MRLDDIQHWLADPFPIAEVKWRIGPRTRDKAKGQPLCYIDARAVMQRLDEIVGPDNWQTRFEETPKRVICHLGILTDNGWIWKCDGAGDTDMESEKGGLSDAFKRAAVMFGIGRYLYGIKAPWVELDERGNLPKSFNGAQYLKPAKSSPWVLHQEAVKRCWGSIVAIKDWLAEGNFPAAWEALNELDDSDKMALRMAPTKGAIWTVEEGKKLRRAAEDDFDQERGVYKSVADAR